MTAISMNLRAPTAPTASDPTEIGKDPIFCMSCLNLDGASAQFVALEQGVNIGFSRELNEYTESLVRTSASERMYAERARLEGERSDFPPHQVETHLVDMASSAKAGCETCSMLESVVTRMGGGGVSFNDPSQAAMILFTREVALRVRICRVDVDDDDTGSDDDGFFFPAMGGRKAIGNFVEDIAHFELYSLRGEANPWPSIGSLMSEDEPWALGYPVIGGRARHVPRDPNTPSCYTLVPQWLQTCLESHEACRQATALGAPLPKRVVAVGSDTNTDIHLIETDLAIPGSATAPPGYLALSHCWGKSVHLTTTTSTLAQRKVNIQWADLPPTFRDAVLLTRRLGFAYLWIDSMCIIQDDAQDWVNESAKMASIYQGAQLVLAATSSVDGEGGCLFSRDAYLEIQGTSHDGTPFRFFARKKRNHAVFNAQRHNTQDLNVKDLGDEKYGDYPLLTRAWCFQERLLATRMLHFTAGEIVFDCLEGIECECGRLTNFTGDMLRRSRQIARLGLPLGGNFAGGPYGRSQEEATEHFLTWRQLVVQYSDRHITFPADRLPALSGVASVWHGDNRGHYLCGIWTGDAERSLIWAANEPNRATDKAEYIAPSWSWARIRRGVSWKIPNYKASQITIAADDANSGCVLDTTDPFGRVRAGWLCLKGEILRLRVTRTEDTYVFVEKDGTASRMDLDRIDTCHYPPGTEVIGLRVATRPGVSHVGLALTAPSPEDLPEDVRGHTHVYQRIGIIEQYLAVDWNHDAESEKVTLYLV